MWCTEILQLYKLLFHWQRPLSCLCLHEQAKLHYPNYADTHATQHTQKIWKIRVSRPLIPIMNQFFDSLTENKFERWWRNLFSCFRKKEQGGEKKVFFGFRERFPALFHDLISEWCRHTPPPSAERLAWNILDLLLILQKQLFLYN